MRMRIEIPDQVPYLYVTMAKSMMMVMVVFASLIAVVAAGEDDSPLLSLTAEEASESEEVIEQQDEALAPEPAGDEDTWHAWQIPWNVDLHAANQGIMDDRVGWDFSRTKGVIGGFAYVGPGIFDDRRRLRNLLDDDVIQQVEALKLESAGDDLLAWKAGLLGGRVGYAFSLEGRTGGLVVTGKYRKRGYFRRG